MNTQRKRPEITKVRVVWEYDPDATPDDIDPATRPLRGREARDADARWRAWRDDEWYYEGCYAVAELRTPSGTFQEIRTAGLWGIESDSGEGYRREVESEQMEELSAELAAFGITASAEWLGGKAREIAL
jgi:hypothetical protein